MLEKEQLGVTNSKLKVLLIQDNPLDNYLLTYFLTKNRKANVEITQICLLKKAMDMLRNNTYSIIFLDLYLPDSQGFGTLIQLNKIRSEIPIVILTSDYDERMGIRATECGAQDYINKNRLDIHSISRVIKYALEKKQTERLLKKKDKQITGYRDSKYAELMAKNLAHEFKNILQIIMGYSDILANCLDPKQKGYEYVEEIASLSRNGTELIRQTFASNKAKTIEYQDINITCLVATLVRLLKPILKDGVDLAYKKPKTSLTIRGSAIQIQQVIVNLVLNAQNAIEKKGHITIACEDISSSYDSDHKKAAEDEEYILLTVKDNGNGIPGKYQHKVFEPQFSLKHHPYSAGLGLTITKKIVKEWGGALEIESQPQRGTKIAVYIPKQFKTFEYKMVEKPQTEYSQV